MEVEKALREIDKKMTASSNKEQSNSCIKYFKIIIKLLVINCANCPQLAKHALAQKIVREELQL